MSPKKIKIIGSCMLVAGVISVVVNKEYYGGYSTPGQGNNVLYGVAAFLLLIGLGSVTWAGIKTPPDE